MATIQTLKWLRYVGFSENVNMEINEIEYKLHLYSQLVHDKTTKAIKRRGKSFNKWSSTE